MIQTYPDGSSRVGEPPFPKRSPLQEAAGVPEPQAETVAVELPQVAPIDEPTDKPKRGRPKKVTE